MISVDQALEILHDNIPDPVQKRVSLSHAYGCRVSVDIFAPEASPRYTNSAMDGFAVKWEDCKGASKDNPISIKVIGESQAGIPFKGRLRGGSAIRISTGAMLPDGADTVVRVEDTSENDGYVSIMAVNALGQDVRCLGEEFQKGELLFPQTTCLQARELAMLASVGVHTVDVFMPPSVSLLITGSELAQYDDEYQTTPDQELSSSLVSA